MTFTGKRNVVVLLTFRNDGYHTRPVIRCLKNAGAEVLRLNFDYYTERRKSINSLSKLLRYLHTKKDERIAFWYRKPLVLPSLHRQYNHPDEARHVREEHEEFVRSVLERFELEFPGAYWLNNYRCMLFQPAKPTQLIMAKSLGIKIPKTQISSNQKDLNNLKKSGQIISKMLFSEYVDTSLGRKAMSTVKLTDQIISGLDTVQYMPPMILQEMINKRAELRVTVIGFKFFVARMEPKSKSYNRADWRYDQSSGELLYSIDQLSTKLQKQLLKLMKMLKVDFASIDLAVDQKGVVYFLELNTNGQWVWLEERLKFGIPQIMADQLMGIN